MSMPSNLDPVEARIGPLWSNDKASFVLPYMIALLIISAFFDSILLGIVLCQSLRWVQHIKEEKRLVIICVTIATLSSIAGSAYLMVWLTQVFVWGFGTYKEFARIKWVTRYSIICDISSTAVQICYTERAYRINKNKRWIPLVVFSILLVTWGMHITAVTHANIMYTFASPAVYADPIDKAGIYTWITGALIIDLLITTCIAYGLWKHKTGWKKTDSIVKRMIFLSLETQIPALVSAVLVLATWGRKMLVLIFILPQPKIYTIGLLAVLNFRFAQREDSSQDSGSNGAQIYPPTDKVNAASIGTGGLGTKEVRVDVETYVMDSLEYSQPSTYTAHNSQWGQQTTYTPPDFDARSLRTAGISGNDFVTNSSKSNLSA